MQRFTISLALLAAALPAAAYGQSTATGNVAVGGKVALICILGDPSSALIDLGQMATTSGTRVGRITTIAARSVSLPASFCNFAGSAVRVDATALRSVDPAAPPTGFARAVNFTATATNWAATPAAATTAAVANGSTAAASGTGSTQPLPKISDIGLTLSSFTVPGDAILVAGTYNGTIVVTLGPAASAE